MPSNEQPSSATPSQPAKPSRPIAPQDDSVDLASESVAGEEDPGAALEDLRAPAESPSKTSPRPRKTP